MKKNFTYLFSVFFYLLIIISFVLASHIITTSTETTSYSVDEDLNQLYNITINNTDATEDMNISEVNITLPLSFTFVIDSNETDAGSHTFINNSNILSWDNDGLVMNGTWKYFWFNATASIPGDYNITVTTTNATGSYFTNISVTVNDTTIPFIDFEDSTEDNGANLSQDYIFINLTIIDENEKNVTFYLFNTTSLVNSTTYTDGTHEVNFTNLPDGGYGFNVTVYDNANHLNSTETRFLTLDTVNPLIVYDSSTESDAINISQDYIFVNVSIIDDNPKNVTFYLYNSSGLVNFTTYPTTISELNFTNLPDEDYTFNVTVYDIADNVNYTTSRTITLDTTNPLIDFDDTTEDDYANLSQDYIFVNLTLTEINEANVTFYLYNSTSLVNSTTYTDGTHELNFTNLPEEDYTFNVTIYDVAGNTNSTASRTLTLDTTNPLIEYGSNTLANASNSSKNYIFINVSVTETNEKNITFVLYNSTGEVNSTTYSTSTYEVNFTNLTDGEYTFNVTTYDFAGNFNSTTSRIIEIDTTLPVVTLITPINNLNATTTAYNFTFNVTDDEIISNCSLIFDSAIIHTITTVNRTGGNNSMYNSSLSAGTHTWSVNCTDNFGNTGNSSTRTLIVYEEPEEEETSSVSNTGGVPTYNPEVEELEVGYEKVMYENWKVKFKASDSSSHTLTVSEINENSAKIILASDPQEAILKVGEEKKFDLTKNGYYDIYVKLNSIDGPLKNKANFTIQTINELINVPQPIDNKVEEKITIPTTMPEIKEETNFRLGFLIFGLLLIIGIFFLVLFLLRAQKFKPKNKIKK